jgi:hypothetical protein
MNTPEQVESKTVRIIRVGPDQVTISPDQVVIEAKNEMPDWQVREINYVPVYFEDKKYFLLEARRAERPYAMRYLLKPWPEGQHSSAKTFHSYDAEAVRERDGDLKSVNRMEGIRILLLPFYPFLGLFWSGVQRWLMRFGFMPRTLTSISIFTVFCGCFAQGVFAVVLINATMRSGKLMVGGMIAAMLKTDHIHLGSLSLPVMLPDVLLTLAFLADIAIRYSNYLREDEWYGGFLEWMVPRWARRKTAATAD